MSRALNVIFAGTPDFAATSLNALLSSRHRVCAVYTQPDRPAGRGRKLTPSPVKQLALQNDIEVLQPQTLKSPDAQAQLRSFNADIMVVVAYGLLLPPAVLETPRMGCINVHASILPRWRGAAPIQRAILAGDTKTGVTIMQMDVGLDTGDMLLVKTTPIEPVDTAQTLHDRLAAIGAQALLEALEILVDGKARPEKQDDAQATYAEKLQKLEAVIDWRQSAAAIHRKICAFNPWPVAQTTLEDKTIRLWQSEVLPQSGSAPAGRIVEESKAGIDVATGDGLLRIRILQLPGGKPLAAADFLNAHSVKGNTFGY